MKKSRPGARRSGCFHRCTPSDLRRLLHTAALMLPAAIGSAADASIHRCVDTAGAVLFSQFGCSPDTHREIPPDAPAISIIASPPLTRAELHTLERLEQELAQDARAREQAAKKRRKAFARQRAEAQAHCDQARAALERIDRIRRKGYSAAQDPKLDADEQRWERERRASC